MKTGTILTKIVVQEMSVDAEICIHLLEKQKKILGAKRRS